MSILSQLRNSEPGLPHFAQGFFRDDRLYRYLNVYPLKGLCEGSLIHSNHHANRIPPIHRLPVELLAEIFRHYVQIVDESQPSLSLCVQPFSQTTPFRLGQVCYYWRSITLSMGDLWQSIFIGPPRMVHIPLIRLWLSHAGDHSLSIWLFQSRHPSESELQATHEVLALLVECFHSWKAIQFCFSGTVHQALLNLPHGAAISLEAACIDVRRWDRASADNLWRALHSSPSLCKPDWVNLYWNEPPDHAPWAQLTHITLDGLLPVDVVLGALQYCINAVALTLPYLGSPRIPFEMSPFVLTQLRTVRISTETELGPLFQSLLLPNLVSLDIMYRLDSDITRSSLPLADLIHRSRCELRELTLRDIDPNICEDELLGYLHIPALRSLVELRVYNKVTDKTVKLLSSTAGKEQLLPQLQAMTLTCCTSDGLVSDMIVSRMPYLRTVDVTLHCDRHLYQRDQATLGNKQREGHNIEVSVDSSDLTLFTYPTSL